MIRNNNYVHSLHLTEKIVKIEKNRPHAGAPKARRLVTSLFPAAPSAPQAPQKHEYRRSSRIQHTHPSTEDAREYRRSSRVQQKPPSTAEAPEIHPTLKIIPIVKKYRYY